MEVLSSLEHAVLDAIALQIPEVADALAGQQGQVRVTARENTGAGFYTTLDVSHRSPIKHVWNEGRLFLCPHCPTSAVLAPGYPSGRRLRGRIERE